MTRIPLRRRLLLVVLAAVAPLAIMAAFALYTGYHQQRAEMNRTGLDIARAVSGVADGELRRTMSVLQTLGGAESLARDDLPTFHRNAQRVLALQSHWGAIILSDPQGRVILHTSTPVGGEPPQIVEGESHAKAVETGVPVVGYLAKGPQGRYAFPVRVPISRDRSMRYVLTAVVQPTAILTVLQRRSVGEEGWIAAVADAKGVRVARTRAQAESLGTPFSPSLIEMMTRGGATEGKGETLTSEGEAVFTAYTRHPVTGWTTAVGIPVKVLEAGARQSIYTLGAGIVLSILFGLLAATLLARRILEPMSQLREAAGGMARGELVAPGSSEIAEIQDVSTALAAASAEQARARAEREELLSREQQARSAAETANRAKDEFLAMLGHELRNPLAAISNAVALMERGKLPPDRVEQMRAIIARQVGHLTRLMDDLLDAGRAIMGKIVLHPLEVDFRDTVTQSLATLRASGRLRTHVVHEDLESVPVRVDPVRADQIVSNLLVNAAKYTPQPGNIRVTLRREGAEAVLRVADDGIGLSEDLAARVFDLFVQGDRDLDRSQGGLGIGLTLVRRLAELHGGSATVRSDGPGKGSEFCVRLPALHDAVVDTGPAPAPRAVESRRILIVEDNVDGRESLKMMLELSGHHVDAVAEGTTAVEVAIASHPDVALIDLGLPGIDGYEVARRIRASSNGASQYLVALTGYGTPEDRDRALGSGFDEHVAKPVTPESLGAIVARAVRNRSNTGS